MAKKKKKIDKPRRELTRRQLSHWQQQKKRQRLIFISGISIVAAVVIIVTVGWYMSQYRPLHETVIKVNDTEFDMDYYIKALDHYGQGEYMQTIADEAVKIIQRNELIKQQALELGISISKEEANDKLKENDLPRNDDQRNLISSSMMIEKLRDDYFDKQVPLAAEQRHIMAMFLEDEEQAKEVRARLENGESFTDLAGELSLDDYSQSKQGDLGWHPQGILPLTLGSSLLDEYAFNTEVGALSPPVYDEEYFKNIGYWLIKILETRPEEGEAHVQAMLLGTRIEAQEIKARLENGESFTDLAKELSQHMASKDNGGDLGWISPDETTHAFDEFTFNPDAEVETVSAPLLDDTAWTSGGYWLVKVTEADAQRTIEDTDRDLLKSKALNEWATGVWENHQDEIESFLDEEKKQWAIEKASKG